MIPLYSLNNHQVIQSKATFSSPSWRSIHHWFQGSRDLTIPKGSPAELLVARFFSHCWRCIFLLKMLMIPIGSPKQPTSWWFQAFFIFTPTWGNDPIWLLFLALWFKDIELRELGAPAVWLSLSWWGHTSIKPLVASLGIWTFRSLWFLAMECDPHLFSRIKDPWKNKLRSLLVENPSDYNQWKCGDSALFYGIAGQWKDERQIFEMYNLIPFKGLSLSPNPIVGLIERDEQCSSVSIPAGAMFGVADAVVQSVSPLQLKITDNSKLWYISDVDRHFPINFCHHFCGSFGGWGRACEWLASSKDFRTKSVISVDAAYDVMKIWSLQNNSSFLEQHIPCSHVDSAQHVGALMPIQNLAWTNLCRYQCNMVCTFSPPCQPWSLGGVGMGFESDNGMSMGSAIYAIRIVRPIIALFECADTVPGHPHYKLIRYGLAFAGYTMVWTSISTYHELSAMQRSRWLSIWVRNDIKSFEITGDFKMSVPGKMPWNHAMYSFFLPFALRQQLLLDDQLRGIYGDVRFLPKNRKSCLSVGVGCEGVLQARVLPEKSQMPTLCASYTQQHLLSEDHLLKKGIFAPLAKIGEDFLFIDPFRFISLLGMPCDQTIFCDCDTEVIFRHIGNAISVPHALVSILIALTSVGFTRIPIVRSVVECWNARTMRVYAVVLVARDFFIITPKDKAKFFFHHCGLSQSKGDICLSFTDVDGTWFVPSETTIESFLSLCGFENIVDQGIQCAINRVVVHPSTTIGSLQGFDVDIEWFSRWINPDAECIASFQIHMQHTQEWTPPPIVAGSQSGEHENVHEVLRDDPPNEPVLSGCEVFPCFLFFTPTGEKIECFLPQHVTADDFFLTFCSLRLNLKDPPTSNGVNVHFFVMGKGSSLLLIRILLFSQNSDLQLFCPMGHLSRFYPLMRPFILGIWLTWMDIFRLRSKWMVLELICSITVPSRMAIPLTSFLITLRQEKPILRMLGRSGMSLSMLLPSVLHPMNSNSQSSRSVIFPLMSFVPKSLMQEQRGLIAPLPSSNNLFRASHTLQSVNRSSVSYLFSLRIIGVGLSFPVAITFGRLFWLASLRHSMNLFCGSHVVQSRFQVPLSMHSLHPLFPSQDGVDGSL